MPTLADRVSTAAVILAALAVTGSITRKEFFGWPPNVVTPHQLAPAYDSAWRSYLSSGHWLGDSAARNVVIEFADFECPFCAHFETALDSARAVLGSDLAVYYIHFPITDHRFAVPAANAAECAAASGRFPAFHDALFAGQDSLGLKTWATYAREAGVLDMDTFTECVDSGRQHPLVGIGRALGEQLRIRGTPTVFVNGWRYDEPPGSTLIREIQSHPSSGQ